MPTQLCSVFLATTMTEKPYVVVPPNNCPNCGICLDAATCVSDAPATKPSEGDVTVCINCGSPLCFNADLTLRIATYADFGKLSADDVLGLGLLCGTIRRQNDKREGNRHGTD